jgi:hypothetical protein
MRYISILLLSLLTLNGYGQTNYINLETAYSINAVTHGEKELGQAYTLDQVKAKFGAFHTRRTTIDRWTDAQVMTSRVFSAAYMNEIIKTCAFGPAAVQLVSVVNISLPSGKWLSDQDCILPYGTVTGQGTFVAYPTNPATTQIVMDNAGWQGDQKVRTLFRSPSYGNDTWVGGYHESFAFRNVRLTGNAPQWMDPAYKSYGLYIFDCGETGDVSKVYAETFNTAGFCFERSTPATADLLTAFNCNYAAIHLVGTALASMNFGTVSSDDCPSVFHMDAGGGREAGANAMDVDLVKLETGVTPESRGPWKGMIVGNFRGQFAVNIDAISMSAAFVKVNTMFFVDPRLMDGTLQSCVINVGITKGFNADLFVQDAASKKSWKHPGNYVGFHALYTSVPAKVQVNETKADATSCKCPDRLGFFKGPGTFDYTNCLPKYSYTSPH